MTAIDDALRQLYAQRKHVLRAIALLEEREGGGTAAAVPSKPGRRKQQTPAPDRRK